MWVQFEPALVRVAVDVSLKELAAAAGTWTDGFLSGTTSVDPAWEANGNTSAAVSGTLVVQARRGVDGSWRFRAATC